MINPTFNNVFVSCYWYKNNKQVAGAQIKIRQRPKNLTTKYKLAGKYPITSINDTTIRFWVGNFKICFGDTRNKENIEKFMQLLLKLPGFKKASNQKIIKQSINVYESINQIQKG